MAAKQSPVTYMWRTLNKPAKRGIGGPWAAETRFLPTVEQGGEHRTSIPSAECDGHAYGLAPAHKSDVALIPVCLGNGGNNRALALCDTYLAAGGDPTEACSRPFLVECLAQPDTQAPGVQIGFVVTVGLGASAGSLMPSITPLANELLSTQLNFASIRHHSASALEVEIEIGDPLVAADHCEMVQGMCSLSGCNTKISQVLVSTEASRGEGGAATLLSRLTAASNGAGVSANSRTGRFYIPASVARIGSGHYVDQEPAVCADSYRHVINVLDLWTSS